MIELGRTGLRVSRLGLGLASIGGLFSAVPREQALATIDRAWELGVRLFDTAPVYGYGRSERRAGAVLGSRPRDEYVLCTKVGRLIEPGGPDTQPIWADPPAGVGPRLDYSYRAVIRSLEESLDRLGMDRVDVLHIHDPEQDYPTAVTEAFRALTELRARDVIRAVSIGVNHADVAARFLREVAEPGPDCVLLAGRYNLLDQSALIELLPLCLSRSVAVIGAGVYAGGILTGGELSGPVAAIEDVCRQHGVPLLAAALQFPLRHPAVPAVLVGARSPAEIEQSSALLEYDIPPTLWTALERKGLLPPVEYR